MISDKAYLISSQEGLKVSRIYEEGFTSSNFNEKTYYSLDDIIENIDTYDPIMGKPEAGFPGITTSAGGPSVKELQKLIKIGDESASGVFCEKPPLHLDGLEVTVFPLGSPGKSLDHKENSRGFDLGGFLEGGIDGDRYVENISECPIEGRSYNWDFKKESEYDNKILYTFEGANVSEKKSIEDINILKFPSTPEYESETVSLKVPMGAKLSYSPEINEDKDLLEVNITREDGTPYTDFYVEDGNLITSKNALTENATLTLKLTYHRYFRGRDGENGINWKFLSDQASSVRETTKNNFLKAPDLVDLKAEISNNSNIIHFFVADVNIKEAGDYYLSLYARNKSVDKDAYLYGMGLVPSSEYSSFWTGVASLNTNINRYPLCAESSLKRVSSYVENSTTYGNISGCRLLKTWKRVSRYFPSLQVGGYKVIIWVTSGEGKSLTPGEFSICGMKIEKGSLSPYDYRVVDYTNRPLAEDITKKSHVLYFNFKLLTNEQQDPNLSDWAISYLRKFEGCKEDRQSHLDSIGSTSFGYKGGSIVYNTTEMDSSEKGIPDLNELYNNWERVIIAHKKNQNSVDIKVINSGNYRQGKKSVSYILEGVPVANFLPKMPDSKVQGDEALQDESSLILGGMISGGRVTTFNGVYRNLCFIKGDLEEGKLEALEKQTLDIALRTRTSISNGNTKEKVIVMHGDFLQEEM